MVACTEWRGKTVYLVKPLTYINATGPMLLRLSHRLGFRADGCILVHDDIDLALGAIRQRMKGSSGGHNGVRSIIHTFQTENIRRVSIGVGQPQRNKKAAKYVLTPFSSSEQPAVERTCTEALDRVLEMVASWPARG
jgi:PTH1 family peptidyl-tRNA hydrolase